MRANLFTQTAVVVTLLAAMPCLASPNSSIDASGSVRMCAFLNPLKPIPVGVTCMTSKGAVFEKVSLEGFGEGWKENGVVTWSDVIASKSDQNHAAELCKSKGGELPSYDDFKRAESEGFRDILPHIYKKTFWSSSVISGDANEFNGDDGLLDLAPVGDLNSVRCVVR